MGMLPGPNAGALFALGDGAIGVLLGVDQSDVAFVGLSLFVQQSEDPLSACQAHNHQVQLVGYLADRARELFGHVQEGNHDADAESQAGNAHVGSACGEQHAAHNSHAHVQHVADIAQDRHEHVGVAVGLFGVVEQLVVDLVKLFLGFFLVAEHFDHFLAVHHFFHKAFRAADGLLLADKELGGLAADLFHHKDHGHHADHHHQSQPQAVIQHDGDHGDDSHSGDQQLGHALGDHLAEGVDIVGVVAHHVAVIVGVEILDRQILHAVEHALTHFGQGALGDDSHQLVVHSAGDQAKDVENSQQSHQTQNSGTNRFPASLGKSGLFYGGDDVLHEHRGHRADDGVKQDADQGDRKHDRVEGEQHFDQPQQDRFAFAFGQRLAVTFSHHYASTSFSWVFALFWEV
ncbi:uncharacterized protein BN452_02363 [Clostridium sp. CAG:1013]|nr:uncharacterized protein BN452_02363 [Clostridium sp. CAG:1013]